MKKTFQAFLFLLFFSPLLVYQNCQGFKTGTVIESIGNNYIFDRFRNISSNLGERNIQNKFGFIDGPAHAGLNNQTQTRFNKMNSEVAPGVRIYNYWLSSVEPDLVSSNSQYQASVDLLNCPAGNELFPPRGQKGRFNYYRCINRNEINKFKELFQSDIANGIRPFVSIYGTPEQYRPAECQRSSGFVRLNNTNVHVWGCPPDDLKQFEDLVRIYISELNGQVKDFSLWNENNSDGWFYIRTGQDRVEKYYQMLLIVDRILKEENINDYRLYVSLDFNWQINPESGQSAVQFLNELWEKPRIREIPWSLNLHPYTDEQARDPNGFPEDERYRDGRFYGFGDLNKVIAFQREWLQRGNAYSTNAPQLYLFLGEQGWYLNESNRNAVAQEICKAQDIMMNEPYVIGAAYNTLFVEGSGDQGGLGLLQRQYMDNLVNMDSEPTYRAMKSTHPSQWGVTRSHYCCTEFRKGCSSETNQLSIINGGWSDWSNVGSCSAECGGGLQNQNRSCNNPTPANGGAQCSGNTSQQVQCNTQACSPVESVAGVIKGNIDEVKWVNNNKQLSIRGWTCAESYGHSIRVDIYHTNLFPSGIGVRGGIIADKPRESAVASSCRIASVNTGFEIILSESESAAVARKTLYVYGIHPTRNNLNKAILGSGMRVSAPRPQPVNGGWSGWSNVGSCSAECGGGLQNQNRSCNNPTPANGGAQCSGNTSQQVQCNTQACSPVEHPQRNQNTQTVRASVGGISGQTGSWWCQAHFGGNLGGGWVCVSGGCDRDATINQEFTCEKRYNDIQQVTASIGDVVGQTGSWWCQAHFGGNLGGTWDCVGSRCSQNAVRGEVFQCGRR